MPDQSLAPIMIGITGKRELNGKDMAVRGAIDACFDVLDRGLTASSKLLLTGLASGVDTIAAHSALARGWKVIAVLPFALELFAQDFDAAGAEELRALADPKTGLLANSEKGRVVVLAPLIDPGTKQPFPAARISRNGDAANPARTDHYEQVGLKIADSCALMIAVMPATEQPDRIGGTARIANYRIRGMLDVESERIRGQSQELRKSPDLDSPQAGPLWVIDLDSVAEKSGKPLNSVQSWEFESPAKIKAKNWTNEKESIRSLKLAFRLNAFNEMAKSVENNQTELSIVSKARNDKQWEKEVEEHKRPDLGDATSSLRRIRHALSIIQGDNKQRLRHTVIALAVFFILAVMAVEFHILSESKITIIGYFALLLAIVVVFRLAKYRILQQYYEDYRAVAEALRVQIAWWDAGLKKPEHRVDQTYLSGAAGSLALVRAAIRHLIDAAFLERSEPKKEKDKVAAWVRGQREYFEARTEERGKLLTRLERIIWFLFDASLGMASSLIPLALMLESTDTKLNSFFAPIDKLLIQTPGLWWLTALAVAFIIAALFAGALKVGPEPAVRRVKAKPRKFEHLNVVIGFVAGVLMTVCIYAFVAGANPFDDELSHYVTHHMSACSGKDALDKIRCSQNIAHNLTIAVMIILASIAGALRFYAERLALEAELHSYREALEVFRRAESYLVNRKPPISDDRYDSIVLEIGMHALKESESWIRAHRVRPLEPHV